MSLTGKTALVTGASKGIGRAIARRLARDGAMVWVHCRGDLNAARTTMQQIADDGGRALLVEADLGAGQGAIDAMFDQIDRPLSSSGDTGIDILVNNAGVDRPCTLETLEVDVLEALLQVNVIGALLVTQQAARRMRHGGRIVNISSSLTRIARADELPYTMTKGAVEQMTRVLAQHLGARGITVNTVAPGITRTDMTSEALASAERVSALSSLSALGRLGEPTDIADVVSLLVSPAAHWITGQRIDASGGFSL